MWRCYMGHAGGWCRQGRLPGSPVSEERGELIGVECLLIHDERKAERDVILSSLLLQLADNLDVIDG